MADDISLCPVEIDPWLARATARRPEAVALETPEERLTYRELLMAATRAAARLVSRGAAPRGRGAVPPPPRRALVGALPPRPPPPPPAPPGPPPPRARRPQGP